MPGTLLGARDTAVNKTDQVLTLQGLSSLEGGSESEKKRKKKKQENVRDISEMELTELDYILHVGWCASSVRTTEEESGKMLRFLPQATVQRHCLVIRQNKKIDPRTRVGRVEERNRK